MTATECLEGVGSLVLSAEGVDLAASGTRLPRVSILAYTGGIMKVPGWGNTVIDLASLDATDGVAILGGQRCQDYLRDAGQRRAAKGVRIIYVTPAKGVRIIYVSIHPDTLSSSTLSSSLASLYLDV